MKNFKYLVIIFAFFLVFALVGSARADLASTKALYLERIDNKQAAVQAQIDRIAELSYINATAQTQLTNNFNSYNTNYLVALETQINASTTEDQVIDLINSDWQLPYMILVKSMFNYANANISADRIQTGYQLINDTRTFVANYTTGEGYSLSKNNRQFVLKWGLIEGAYAAATTGWTCRKLDGTDPEVCEAQANLKDGPCYWNDEYQKCVGSDREGADFAEIDGDEETCAEMCVGNGLTDCYENSKCAANGLLEEYIIAGTCGNSTVESEEECDWGTTINAKDCSPRYGSDGVARTCNNCNSSDCSITVLTGVVCGDGIINGRSVFVEECDDANSVDATSGDLCYNDCTKRYLDAGDTTALDAALTKLDDYESDPINSLDTNTSDMDTLLANIYNVYNQGITENEKIALVEGYEQSLESIYSDTQSISSGIVTEVANILAL